MNRLLRVIIAASALILASGAPAQQGAPATPTPTPVPVAPAKTFSVRLELLPEGQKVGEGQVLPLDPAEVVDTESTGSASEESENELVIAPLPLSNPAIGSGLGFATVYTIAGRETEKKSPPTTLGGGGFYTNNGSWAGGAGIKMYLSEDRYRITLAAAVGNINYDLFGEGSGGEGYPIGQEFKGGLGEVMVGVGKRWYAGLRASYGTTNVTPREGAGEAIPVPPDQLDVSLAALGLKSERDGRDSVFYPTDGWYLQLLVNHSDPGFGSDYSYTKTTLSYSDCVKLDDAVILAWQAHGCYASTGAPFFDLCLFGSQNVLRGYTVGKYIDQWTLATQAEVRWRFANRWLTTAFAGVGSLKPQYSLAQETELLPAGGLGVQWIAAPENMITVRVDYAFGSAGSRGLYIGIGQAF